MDLSQVVAELIEKGVAVEFITGKSAFLVSARDPFAEFRLNIMAPFAQLEHSVSKERYAEGIRAAKVRRLYQGRAPKMKASQLAAVRELFDASAPRA